MNEDKIQLRVITTGTVLTVRYDLSDAQDGGEVDYDVEPTDEMGRSIGGGSIRLQVGDQVSRQVFEDVRLKVESEDMAVIGIMVPRYLLPYYIQRFSDEFEVYPL